MYTYKEAKDIADTRTSTANDYHISCGSPRFYEVEAYSRYLQNMPEDVYNYNQVSRCQGIMLVGESAKGFYEYPTGLLAWGGPIPDEAYISAEDLEKPIWEVVSKVIDYSDW